MNDEPVVFPSVRAALQDVNIVKVGISLNIDTGILAAEGIIPSRAFVRQSSRQPLPFRGLYGFFDLGLHANNRMFIHNPNGPNHSLDSLAREFLHETVDGGDIQRSDWSMEVLTPEMLEYAALDAHIVFRICVAMTQHVRAQ